MGLCNLEVLSCFGPIHHNIYERTWETVENNAEYIAGIFNSAITEVGGSEAGEPVYRFIRFADGANPDVGKAYITWRDMGSQVLNSGSSHAQQVHRCFETEQMEPIAKLVFITQHILLPCLYTHTIGMSNFRRNILVSMQTCVESWCSFLRKF